MVSNKVSDNVLVNVENKKRDTAKLELIPVFTEKSQFIGKYSKYIVKSFNKLNKDEIKSLVKSIYNVDVIKVNTSMVTKKKRTIKYNKGYQKVFKKVFITLKDGQVISDFDRV